MVYHYKRKNDKLNNAAAGLASGAIQGLQLGMQAKQAGIANARADEQMRRQAANDEFEREQALVRAKQAADELEREKAQRETNEAAVSSQFQPRTPTTNMNPLTGPAVTAGMATINKDLDEQDRKVYEIGAKMAKMGTPLKDVQLFVEQAREKKKKIVDDARRKQFIDQLGRVETDGRLFGTNPDGSKASNPNVEKSLQELHDIAANPDIPVDVPINMLRQLQYSQRAEDTRRDLMQRKMRSLDAGLQELEQIQSMGPDTPESARAKTEQYQAMRTLRDQWFQHGEEISSIPGGSEAFEQMLRDVKDGIAQRYKTRDGREIKVPFGAKDLFTQMQEESRRADELEAARADELRARAEALREKTQTIAPESQARIDKMRQDALAKMVNAQSISYGKRRGGLTDEKALDLYIKANVLDADKMTPDELVRGAKALQDAMNGDGAVGSQSGPTPEQIKRGEEAKSRMDDFSSEEELRAFINDGVEPKKKK